MIKQLRYLWLTGLLMLVGTVILIWIGYRIALEDLQAQEEQKTLAISRALIHAYWTDLEHLLQTSSHEGHDHETETSADASRFHAALIEQLEDTSIRKVNVFNHEGIAVYSTEASDIGEDESGSTFFQTALLGNISSEYITREFEQNGQLETRQIVGLYLPIQHHEEDIAGVFEMYSDVTPQIAALRNTHLGLALAALLMISLVIAGVAYLLRRSSKALENQQRGLERYAHLVRHTPTILFEITRRGKIIFLNPSAKKRFPELGSPDLTDVETLGHPLLTAWESITTNLQPGSTFERELSIAEWVYMQRISYNEQSQNYDIYVHDVTIQKRSEAELLRVQREQRAIIHAIPDMIFVNDKDGNFLEYKVDIAHSIDGPMVAQHVADSSFITPSVVEQYKVLADKTLRTQKPQYLEHDLSFGSDKHSYESRFIPLGTDKIMTLVRDITERKAQERVLRESEAKNRSLIGAFPDLIFLVDKRGKFLEVQLDEDHPLLEPMVGRTFHEIDFIPPEIVRLLEEKVAQTLATRTVQTAEYALPSVGGRTSDYEARFVALDDERVLYVARDVSERKVQESAFRESEAKTRSLITAFPDLVFVVDKNGTFLEAKLDDEHPLMEPLVGRNFSEISFIPEETAHMLKGYVRRAIATDTLQVAEYSLPSLDRISDYEARFVALDDERVLYIARDVSERKRREVALRESEAQVRGLLEAIPDMVFVMSRDGTYLDFKLDKTHGLIEDLTGRNVRELSFMPAQVAQSITEKLRAASNTGDTQVLEYAIQGNIEGQRRLAHYEARFAPIDAGRILMLVRDVTKRHEDEVSLQTLTKEAQRRAQELLLLDRVRSVAAQELELNSVIAKTIGAITETFNYTLASVYLLEGDELVMQYQVGYQEFIPRIPLDKGVIGRVVRTGQPALLKNSEDDPDVIWAFEGINSEICVPLLDAGKVIGALNLESTEQRFFDEADLRLMNALSETLGVAIERARLYQETKASETELRELYAVSKVQAEELSRQTDELELLEHIRTLISNKTELGVLYKTATEVVADALGYELVAISLVEGNTIVNQHQVGYTMPLLIEPGDKGVEGRVIRNGKSELVSDVTQDPEYIEVEPGTKSEVCVPLFLKGRVAGVLIVEAVRQTLGERDLHILDKLGAYMSLAMEQAQLYEEAKASEQTFRELYALSEKQSRDLSRRNDELLLLERVRDAVANELELVGLYQSVADNLARNFGYHAVRIFEVTETAFRPVAQLGVSEFARDIPLSQGVAGRVLRTNRADLIPDVMKDPDYVGFESGMLSEISVPLHRRGEVVGILSVETRRKDNIVLSEDDLRLISVVAEQVDVAIERAYLYEETKANENKFRELYLVSQEQAGLLAQRANELELLNQVRGMISSKLEPQELFKAVPETLAKVFGYDFIDISLLKGEVLEIQHQVGYDPSLPAPQLSIHKGVVGRVARTGKPLLVQDLANHPEYSSPHEKYTGTGVRTISEICVPILGQGKVVGVLNVESAREILEESRLHLLTTVAGYIGIALEQAELYQALQHSEVRYRELIENATDIIYRSDVAGTFTYTNSVVTRMMGYDEDEIIGKHYLTLVRADEREKVQAFYIRQFRNQEATSYLEFPAVAKDGREVWIGQSVGLVKENGRIVGMQAVARDITERKRMEEALMQQAEELSSANADLEQFAFIAAHDLQEPLRKIQAFGDRLNLKYKNVLDEQGRDYLERMRGSATRMRTLIDDLLAFARANKQQNRELVSLGSVIQGVLGDLQIRIEETEATISVGSMPTLELDPSQFRQVFQNLIGNALKFRKPGVPPVITVYNHRLPSGDWQIRVSDNGIGFDEQYKDRIFAVFQRLHSRDQYEGTGIGLAIVRRIIEGHGGSIEVSSRLGEGTTFYVTLPPVAKIHTEGEADSVLA